MTIPKSEHLTRHQDVSNDYLEYQLAPQGIGKSVIQKLDTTPNRTEWVQDYTDNEMSVLINRKVEGPERASELIRDARIFIKNLTGIDVDAPIIWKEPIDGESSWGIFHNLIGAISLIETSKRPQLESMSEYGQSFANMATLVHEMMHATGIDTRRIIATSIDGNTHNASISAGMVTARIRVQAEALLSRNSVFFEEACAEEAAARWRESMEPTRRYYSDEHTLPMRDQPSLPWRYLDANEGLYWDTSNDDITLYAYTYSAYCAEAMRLVSEYSGEDVFSLMVEARNPDKAADAKRRMIQIIEAIEPGLYKKLRELEYTKEEFIEGYKMVADAIKSAKASGHAKAAA